MMRATRASLVGLLLAACSGGQTGQPTSGWECPDDATPASETMARFAGSYESPVTASGNAAECPPEADAVLRVEIESDFDERELLDRECGAAWLPVTVELNTDDGELEATEQGWLTTDELDAGVVRIDEPSFGGGERSLALDPETRSVSSSQSLDGYSTFDACCLETASKSFPELIGLDEVGPIELLPGAPDVVGQDSVTLELRLTSESLANGCFEKGELERPGTFELLDAEGAVVAAGTTVARGTRCPERDGCIWVDLHGEGHVSDGSYLGAAEPLKGEASYVFLEADFNSCEAPRLVELGISVDVQLEEYAIEMGLDPAPSSGIAPAADGPLAHCF